MAYVSNHSHLCLRLSFPPLLPSPPSSLLRLRPFHFLLRLSGNTEARGMIECRAEEKIGELSDFLRCSAVPPICFFSAHQSPVRARCKSHFSM